MARAPAILRMVCLAATLAAAAACTSVTPGLRVAAITIDGNSAIKTSQLQALLVTRPPKRWPWSTPPLFDQRAFAADLDRLRQFYQDRGYPDARVDGVQTTFTGGQDRVSLRVTIAEGDPITISGTSFEGFDVLEPSVSARIDRASLAAGQIRDRATAERVRQQAASLLRDHGFAYATVSISESWTASHAVALRVTAAPGPPAVFGPITIVGAKTVDERVIRRELSVVPGAPYRESRVEQSQRRLSSLDILRFVNVEARPPETGQPREIPVRVVVSEDKPRRLQLGLGYGTEDRVRASIEWAHLNFLGDARQASIAGQLSSIDRGVRTSFTQPAFLRRGLSFDASGISWWTGENIYTSDTYGGRAGLTYRFGGRQRGANRPADSVRAAYVYEFLRYQVRPEILADLTQVSQVLALGLDPVTGAGRGTKTAIAADYDHTATDNLADPRAGWSISLHGQFADPSLGGTFRYRQAIGEGRAYLPLGSTVVATRARAGSIAARTDADVPFSERYFLGGASSLRGWSRYEVAPLTDGVPIGGRTLAEMSLEWRVPVRGPVSLVAFMDAGNVWAGSFAANTGFRRDAGIGARYRTPIGLLRGDLAFQLDPIPGLLVDGQPQTRAWRVHVSIGQAF